MNEKTTDKQADEQALVKLYMDLTGRTESNARCVLMYMDPASEEAGKEAGANEAPSAS